MNLIEEPEFIATSVKIKGRNIVLDLMGGTTFSFPYSNFKRLSQANTSQLEQVVLRVGGRALRWESLDEDIWIADVILQRTSKSVSA
jgi:hypothetical protein